MRIAVAMSGGVDSSTCAGLLVEQGHEVIGLAMKTHGLTPRANRACCTPDDMRDARRVADHLGIPFYVLNYEELFREAVVKPFAEAYVRGHTPNPCIECNDKVKFRPLLERARLLGAERLATGHYARTVSLGGKTFLQRGADRHKDQSYFLYRIGAEQLAAVMFPVGHLGKDEVRAHARRLGLPVADKHESQEICFVGAEGYAATVEGILGRGGCGGSIRDAGGVELGRHEGVHHFTYGQRKGLRIAASEPLYVTGIDAVSGEVTVGGREALLARQIDLRATQWIDGAPPAELVVQVQQRYRESPKPARVEVLGAEAARLHFLEPQPRGAPGQAAVVYHEDRVLGGGTIGPAQPRAAAASEVSIAP